MSSAEHVTILHSNDIHNELYFRVGQDMLLHGGISMLADYVRTVRQEEPNTLYCMCGDILQQDLWGSDYKGMNTINVLNSIRPDAISLGNHELDYGLSHALIFERCLNSKVINANIVAHGLNKHLFIPSCVMKVGDVKILLIGIISQKIFKGIATDPFCRNMMDYVDPYDAIREEIRRHKDEDITLNVLMTHIGLDEDITLADGIPDDCHIDMILGGHSHIAMDRCRYVNGIYIAQADYGTTSIGRFDIEVDIDNKRIRECQWKRVQIDSSTCRFDGQLDELTDRVILEQKKSEHTLLCDLGRDFLHNKRVNETELGDLIADAFLDTFGVDLVILQSGSIRKAVCPRLLYDDVLHEMYPYDDCFYSIELTGWQIKQMFRYLFNAKPDGSYMSGTFQYSRGFLLREDTMNDLKKDGMILELRLNGRDFGDEEVYRVGVTKKCMLNFKKYFDMDIHADAPEVKLLSFSTIHDLERYFIEHDGSIPEIKMGRFIMYNYDENA